MAESSDMKRSAEFLPAEPLHRRVPTQGEDGRPLNDLLMIIPGLKAKPVPEQQSILQKIEQALLSYHEIIVFAELNIKLGTLWLSIPPQRGLGAELAAWIHHHVPETRLVAQHSASEAIR